MCIGGIFVAKYTLVVLAIFFSERPTLADRITVCGPANGPFYLGETLVFMYEPPSNGTPPHSVYLLRDYWSFTACHLRTGKKVTSVTSGNGTGFEFALRDYRPLHFACGEHNGAHYKVGMMRFPLFPFPFKRCHW